MYIFQKCTACFFFKGQILYYLQIPANVWNYLVIKLRCQKPTLQVFLGKKEQIRYHVIRPKSISSKDRKKNIQAIEPWLERHNTKRTIFKLLFMTGSTAKCSCWLHEIKIHTVQRQPPFKKICGFVFAVNFSILSVWEYFKIDCRYSWESSVIPLSRYQLFGYKNIFTFPADV